jgi:hypothetical protein
MNHLDAVPEALSSPLWLAARDLICHTPQPTPPVDDDDDDDDEDDDRGSGGGNIDPDDDESTFDDDEDDDEDTLWTRYASGGVGCRHCARKYARLRADGHC